ncbi:hypothetical protein [Alkaliphilus serpentinus]|uniref:Uncharacterized protein n=1 Tax=Alkaliphilus serpentinus TaxID=1482731 RepID=A0A833HM53_9FIRM|nr:hypothetical protein [Alkaliphilus serpentinus]KAB3527116.1 hypothetical protein F8153_13170 [Alkaliphilus serpentinus]
MFELKKKIQAIIDAYHANDEMMHNEIKRVIDEHKVQIPKLKDEFAIQAKQQILDGMKSAQDNAMKINKVYNQKLKVILDKAKKQVLPEYFNKVSRPSDYATKVNNALQFLMIEAEQITDDKAYLILKDFIDDYDQMKLFKNVIGKRVLSMEDANGNPIFPKTFGRLNELEVILNTFNDMESIANMMFIHPKQSGQGYVIGHHMYSIPVDSQEQMADEANIIKYADTIDEFAKEIPGIKQVTDQTEHETVEG